MTRFSLRASLLVAMTLAACTPATIRTSSDADRANCSAEGAPPGCGDACREADGCPQGLACVNAVCVAACFSSLDCDLGEVCSLRGQCQPSALPDAGRMDSSVCADVSVGTTPVTPNVTIVLDRSGTMGQDFELVGGGSDSRWNVVRNILIGPDGLIPRLDQEVRFGLAMYTAESESYGQTTPITGACPVFELTEGERVLTDINNASNISAVYGRAELLPPIPGRVEDSGETPTGEALLALTEALEADPDPNPQIFLVATDGVPDTCQVPNPSTEVARNLAENAVARAYSAGIRTYMLWIGNLSSGTAETHIQRMANAGIGRDFGSDEPAEYWVGDDNSSLQAALTTIVEAERSCEIRLSGELTTAESACSGSVRLNGSALSCNAADGWRATSRTTIELQGKACEDFKASDASLEAVFPCTVVLI